MASLYLSKAPIDNTCVNIPGYRGMQPKNKACRQDCVHCKTMGVYSRKALLRAKIKRVVCTLDGKEGGT